LLIVDRSLALIGFFPLFMIAGTYRADLIREGVVGAIQMRQREAKDNK